MPNLCYLAGRDHIEKVSEIEQAVVKQPDTRSLSDQIRLLTDQIFIRSDHYQIDRIGHELRPSPQATCCK